MMSKLKLLILFMALTLFSNCIAISSYQGNQVLEVVMFHTKPNVHAKVLLKRANSVTSLLQSLPGFVSRTIAKGQKPGLWIDIVRWESLNQALSAAKTVVNKPKMKYFLALMSSYTMYHFAIKKALFRLRRNHNP